jgi:N-methylhydantoinase B
VFSGTNPTTGQYYVYLETIGGGSGARATKDGLDGVQVHITNTSNLPVECLEMEYPLFVEEYALVPGSGGAGRFRGGLGIRRTVRVMGHEATFLGTLERQRVPPFGLLGGHDGGCGALVQNADRTERRDLGSKIAGLRLRPGESVTIVTPGAGGYGAPTARDALQLARDQRDGKITAAGP